MDAWTLLDSSPGPLGFVKVRTDHYRLADGSESRWDIIECGDSVAVLALTPDRQVILARQYRPGPGVVLNELPGGGIEPGEDPATGAARELLEETGYAGQVEIVGGTWISGNITGRRWFAVATDCRLTDRQQLDAEEDIEVLLVDLAAFRAQLRDGALTDAAAGYRALLHLGLL